MISTSTEHVRLFLCWTLLAIATLLLQGCASIGQSHNPRSMAIPASATDELSRLATQDGLGDGESAFRPLAMSAYALDARLTLVRHAQHSLDIQYYLLKDDDTGRLFLREVHDAADRGVRVRLLVDDLYTASSDSLLLNFAATPNVEVRLFNPFPAGRALDVTRWGLSLLDLARLNHRMHNKLLIADGAMAIVGGRNIADEYFLRGSSGNFVDFDLLTAGAAVPELAATFDRYWNSPRVFRFSELESASEDATARRLKFEQTTKASLLEAPKLLSTDRDLLDYGALSADISHAPLKMLRGQIRVLADDPEKVSGRAEAGSDSTTVTTQVLAAIAGAKEDLLLVSPYFVPGKLGMNNIRQGRAQGVTITVVTNSMAANDEPYVSAAFARYRKQLLEMGVQIYEITPEVLQAEDDEHRNFGTTSGRLHVKGAVIDRHTTFVGSMNMDFRSSRENTEIGLLVDCPQLAADVIGLVSQLRGMGTYRLRLSTDTHEVQWVESRDGKETVYDDEPKVDFLTRLKTLMFFPFISESLL